MKPQPPPPPAPIVQPSLLQDQLIPSLVAGAQRTPPTAGNTTPLIDDLELSAQRNLALARLNSSPLSPLSTNGGAGTEQLYSHLYGSKEIGMMRKMAANMDDYSSSSRNYGLHMHHMPVTPPHHHLNSQADPTMQQNFSPQAKFNQFNYPNAAGLLKPCYDYPHANQMMQNPNQQMKKEMFDLYQTPQSFMHQQNAFNHHPQHQQQQHPSFNQMNGGLLAKLDNTGDNLNEFNTNNNNTNNLNNGNASNKSSDAVLLTRSSILNSNNSNKIEPNNDPLSITKDDPDKLSSSPLTGDSSLNNEHNNDDDNDDGYTIL